MANKTLTDRLLDELAAAEDNAKIKGQYDNLADFDFSDGGIAFANSPQGQQLIKDLATGNSGLTNANLLMDLLAAHLSPEAQEKLANIVMQQLSANLTNDIKNGPWKYILSRIEYENNNKVDVRGNSNLFRQNYQTIKDFNDLTNTAPELTNPLRQIDSKAQAVKPNIASRSFFMSQNDFKFSESLNASKLPTYSSVQPIILNEYQPAYTRTLATFLQDASNSFKNLLNITKAGSLFGNGVASSVIGLAMKGTFYDTLNKTLISDIASNPNYFKASENNFVWYRLRSLFTNGAWLNTYELPFLNNTYLESKEYNKWGLDTLTGGRRKTRCRR